MGRLALTDANWIDRAHRQLVRVAARLDEVMAARTGPAVVGTDFSRRYNTGETDLHFPFGGNGNLDTLLRQPPKSHPPGLAARLHGFCASDDRAELTPKRLNFS